MNTKKLTGSDIAIVGGRENTNYIQLGRLATEIRDYFKSQKHNFLEYKDGANFIPRDIHTIVYTEKNGKRLQEIIDICQKEAINLLNMATGVMDGVKIPSKPNFVLLNAPNADIEILKKLKQIKNDSVNWSVDEHVAFITEGHQWEKFSVPGTAIDIKAYLGKVIVHHEIFPPDSFSNIYTNRSPNVCKILFNIPESHLGGFGAHLIEIYKKVSLTKSKNGLEFVKHYNLKVLGRKSYAMGAYKIVEAMKELPNGSLHISELIEMEKI